MVKCYSSVIYTLSAGGKLNPRNESIVTVKLNVTGKLKVKRAFSYQRNLIFYHHLHWSTAQEIS